MCLMVSHKGYILGPGTGCDTVHLRWAFPKLLRYIKIACHVLQCIFQHVGNSAPNFGISQLFIVRFSNGFQHDNKHLINSLVIFNSKFSV